MNFSEFDIKILTVGIISLLFISATAGATPISGNFGDVPEFEHTATFDATAPSQPGPDSIAERQGTLRYGPDIPADESIDEVWGKWGYRITAAVNDQDNNLSDLSANIVMENSTTSFTDFGIVSVGDSIFLTIEQNNETFEVRFEYQSLQNNVSTVTWEVTQLTTAMQESQQANAGGPISQIASWLGYFAELFRYAVMVVFNAVSFVLISLKDVIVYGANIVGWITGGYGSVLGSAPSWAAAFMSIPVLLLGFEFMKLVMIIVELVWI